MCWFSSGKANGGDHVSASRYGDQGSELNLVGSGGEMSFPVPDPCYLELLLVSKVFKADELCLVNVQTKYASVYISEVQTIVCISQKINIKTK